jgi:hypothetical protein
MSSGAGQLDGSAYPFKGKRRIDRGGARTGKDNRRARHTSTEAARPVLINLATHRRQPFPWVNSGFCVPVISVCYSIRLQFFCLNSGVLLNVTYGQGGIDFAERNG